MNTTESKDSGERWQDGLIPMLDEWMNKSQAGDYTVPANFIERIESQTEKKIIAKVREEIEEMRMASRNEVQNEIVLCKSDLLELPSLNIK